MGKKAGFERAADLRDEARRLIAQARSIREQSKVAKTQARVRRITRAILAKKR